MAGVERHLLFADLADLLARRLDVRRRPVLADWVTTIDRQSIGRYAALGMLAGFAALMRWQDAILLLIPALDACGIVARSALLPRLVRIGVAVAAAVAVFVPQMIVWTVLYGQPFIMPQGSGFMRWRNRHCWRCCSPDNHGLSHLDTDRRLSMSGLVPLTRRYPAIGARRHCSSWRPWYVNAAVADWWAGEAFGARRFLSCYPVLALGLAALFDRMRRPIAVKALTVAFTAYTLLLLLQYQAFMHGLQSRGSVSARFRGLVAVAVSRAVRSC